LNHIRKPRGIPYMSTGPRGWWLFFSFGFTVTRKTRSNHEDRSGQVIQTVIAGDVEAGWTSHQL
jgi:hypothetical protein